MDPNTESWLIRCYLFTKIVFYFIVLIPLAFLLLLYFAITAPFSLYFFSSNWSMQPELFPIVELYLRHFENLHPDLFAYVAAAHAARTMTNQMPGGVRQWPHETTRRTQYSVFYTVTQTSWRFSQGAGLFAKLESAGFPRRVVWAFLKDQVEQAGLVSPAEQAEFAKVMKTMNSHRLWGARGELGYLLGGCKRDGTITAEKQRAAEERFAHLGRPVIHVRSDSVDWLLQRGAILIPSNKIREGMTNLSRHVPLFAGFNEDRDLEGGIGDLWQIIDIHKVWPWTKE